MPLQVRENKVLTTIEVRGTRVYTDSTLTVYYSDPYLMRLGVGPILVTDVTPDQRNWVARIPICRHVPHAIALTLVERRAGRNKVEHQSVTLVHDC